MGPGRVAERRIGAGAAVGGEHRRDARMGRYRSAG
jgi:hypothetical protein